MIDGQQIISRKQAVEVGLAFYFTGRQCKRGHVDRRRVSNNACKTCESEKGKAASLYKAAWYQASREKLLCKAKSNYEKNRAAKLEYSSAYQKKNLPRIVSARKERAKTDAVYAVGQRIRSLIRECLKKSGTRKSSRTSEILGCTTEFFKAHIERQFTKGMVWHNMGQWHIDHIRPMSSAKTEAEVIALNHFTNLRPLWASDNFRKSNKMEFII